MNKLPQKFDSDHPYNDWQWGEWIKFTRKLQQLSLEELCQLATKLGIRFSIGNERITDKDDFINVLNEADKSELLREYNEIIKVKKR
ncbi:MAG: hypothetical protein AB1721_00845 [Patescibacteria group bacterium]